MKVLVTAASKHGATAQIAEAIGDALAARGIETDVRRPEEVTTVQPYDGVVLGSAVYAGRWLGPAKDLIEREAEALAATPVWLFSSGPLGDPAKPAEDPADVAAVRERTRALDHRLFAGKLDRTELGFAEKAVVRVVRAPDGDFRKWDDIAEWASGIARDLLLRRAESAIP